MEIPLPRLANGSHRLPQTPDMVHHEYSHFDETRPKVAHLQSHNREYHETRVHVELHVRSCHLLSTTPLIFISVGPVKTPPSFEALVEGEGYKGVWVKPVPELVVGEIKEAAEKNGVSSIPLPGYWLTKPGAHHVKPGSVPLPGEKVVYCLHGGTSFHIFWDSTPSTFNRWIRFFHCSSLRLYVKYCPWPPTTLFFHH